MFTLKSKGDRVQITCETKTTSDWKSTNTNQRSPKSTGNTLTVIINLPCTYTSLLELYKYKMVFL